LRGPGRNSWPFSISGKEVCKVPNFTSNKVDRAYESFMKQVPGFQRDPPEAKVIQHDLDKDKRKGAQNERKSK
jgi:hypothetical protein